MLKSFIAGGVLGLFTHYLFTQAWYEGYGCGQASTLTYPLQPPLIEGEAVEVEDGNA